MIFYAEW
jgi:PadR family transcriptional regulator